MINPYEALKGSMILRDEVSLDESGDIYPPKQTNNFTSNTNPTKDLLSTFSASSRLNEGEKEEKGDYRGISVSAALAKLFPPELIDVSHSLSVASHGHVDRMHVINMQERLEERCNTEHARRYGVCEIREGIYNDAMDEVVRQVTVLCPER